MAKKIYAVPFPQGWYMLWAMYTQSAGEFHVILKDSVRKPSSTDGAYVNVTRAALEVMPPLAHGISEIEGTNLQLEVETGLQEIKECINTYIINDDEGIQRGYGFNLSLEDSTDDDYNDLYVSMVCWKKKFEGSSKQKMPVQ